MQVIHPFQVGLLLTFAVTVSISGLWILNNGSVSSNTTLPQAVVFRTAPVIFTLPTTSGQVSDSVLIDVYGNRLANWLYEATLDVSFNATPLSWASRDWSFVPVDLSSIESPNQQPSGLLDSTQKVTLSTPAVRAHLDCTPIDTSDTTSWLTTLQFQNRTAWNDPTIPPGLRFGYELKDSLTLPSALSAYTTLLSTNTTAECCGNQFSNGSLGEASVGYWSPPVDNPSQGIVVKWVTGHAYTRSFLDATNVSHWVWDDVPNFTALSCTPVFETANTNVVIDVNTSLVDDFTVISELQADKDAWASNYGRVAMSHNGSSQDISVSHGYLFHDILLGAADSARIGDHQSYKSEDLSDGTYNIRLPGLNTDLMSYTALAMVQNNNSALLDPFTLANISSTVFSKFFQHFFQAAVPDTDAMTIDKPITDRLNLQGTWGLEPRTSAVNVVAKVTTATTQVSVNRVSVFLSICILAVLLIISLVIISLNREILKLLPRDVDTLGSVLGFVYGSDRLLWHAAEGSNTEFREKGGDVGGLREMGGDSGHEMARMGWFNGGGRRRWGIEIVDSRHSDNLPLMGGALPFDSGMRGSVMDKTHSPLDRWPTSGDRTGTETVTVERASLAWGEGRRRLRGESFDTYEAMSQPVLRTPSNPAARS